MSTQNFYQEFHREKPARMGEATLSYRQLKADDLDLAQVFEEGIGEMDEDLDGAKSSVESFKRFLEKPAHFYIVGFVDGSIAGRIFGTIIEHPRGSQSIFIDEVDTLEAHRRKGVAKGLVEEVKKFATQTGIKEMWVGTEIDNYTALALYRSVQPTEDEEFVIFTYGIDNK